MNWCHHFGKSFALSMTMKDMPPSNSLLGRRECLCYSKTTDKNTQSTITWDRHNYIKSNSGQVQWLMLIIWALWEAEVCKLPEVRSAWPAWPTWWNPVSIKNTKISRAWWRTSVIPATQEAEVGELLEPGRRRLQWAKITPLHSSLGDKSETLSKKKKLSFILALKISFFR